MFSNDSKKTTNTVRAQPSPVASRLASSIVVWTLVMLVSVDLFISAVHPLSFYNNGHLTFFDQNVIARELPASLKRLPVADAAVIGSSLPMSAVGQADRYFMRAIKHVDLRMADWLKRDHPNAIYLEHLISKKAGIDVRISNLTCIGMMVSDVWVMVDRLILQGKAPPVLLYGISLRDFVDNTVPGAGRSHIFRTFRVFAPVCPESDPQKVIACLLEGKLSTLWQFYNLRSDYHTLCSNLGNTWREEALRAIRGDSRPHTGARQDGQSKRITPDEERAIKFTIDMNAYKLRYNPPNQTRFAEEMIYYKLLLSLCKREGIKLFVFNMPVSNANRMLIDPGMLKKYKTDTERIATEYGVRYVDLDRPDVFNRTDFIDSSHTCERGALKVHKLLVENSGGLFERVASK